MDNLSYTVRVIGKTVKTGTLDEVKVFIAAKYPNADLSDLTAENLNNSDPYYEEDLGNYIKVSHTLVTGYILRNNEEVDIWYIKDIFDNAIENIDNTELRAIFKGIRAYVTSGQLKQVYRLAKLLPDRDVLPFKPRLAFDLIEEILMYKRPIFN